MANSNNNNSGEIQQGDGEQKVAKDRSVLAGNNSHATYNDYSGATILGEIDESPVLTELHYSIPMQTDDRYQEGVDSDTCEMTVPGNSNTACFSVDFEGVVSNPNINKWIGYSIKLLPMKDWRSFVNSGYSLQFDYMATGTIKEIWLRIGNLLMKFALFYTKNCVGQKELVFITNLSLNKG